ncbi:MAG: transcriptional regulator, partial [Actinomycetes bacterium]
LTGHDGSIDFDRLRGDRLAGGLLDQVTYQLTEPGRRALCRLDVTPPDDDTVRCCVDWTEQRHHLAGRLGAAAHEALLDRGWVARTRRRRALALTPDGARELRIRRGVDLEPAA